MPILRKPEVKLESGWRSDSSITSNVRAGTLTKPIQLGPRSVGWPDYEIKAITAARIAGKSDDQIRALVNSLHAKRQELASV
ncbi:MAG: AlpA family phage regulatory protein [Rhodoferax sp.]|nr:AlpA family phage regulatory protein [Rhodoferax sp.]MCF8209251.1 AlpA family phage regulatory protein [Rhodoferax sp.]